MWRKFFLDIGKGGYATGLCEDDTSILAHQNRVLECTIGSVPLCTSGRLRLQLCVRAFGFTHKDEKIFVFIWFFAH